MSSSEDNSKWKELEREIEGEGFKRAAYQKNVMGGSNEISGMSFRRDNLYINVKRETDEKGNLTDRFDVELYNSDSGATEEQKGLSQDLAWNMAKVAAEAGITYGKAEPAEGSKISTLDTHQYKSPRKQRKLLLSFLPLLISSYARKSRKN